MAEQNTVYVDLMLLGTGLLGAAAANLITKNTGGTIAASCAVVAASISTKPTTEGEYSVARSSVAGLAVGFCTNVMLSSAFNLIDGDEVDSDDID